jgi:hypothetical protein
MDIKLEKKPWYIRYRYYLIGGLLFAAFLIYVIVLSLGPRKLRIDAENIQIAKVKEDNFMECGGFDSAYTDYQNQYPRSGKR